MTLGTADTPASPDLRAPERAWKSAAGGRHTCAIKDRAARSLLGLERRGQATPPAGTFKAIDAGDSHTCAIRTDETVMCWGKNDDGESTAPSGTFSAVSAGGDHSCGLRTDRTLACWGRNTQSPVFNVAPPGSYVSVSAGNTAGTTWSCAVGNWPRRHLLGLQLLRSWEPAAWPFQRRRGWSHVRVRTESRQRHGLLGRVQRRTAHRCRRRRPGSSPPSATATTSRAGSPGRPDALLPRRRRGRTGDSSGRDLPLPERGLLPRLRCTDQRRGCLLGLQHLRAGKPDPSRSDPAGWGGRARSARLCCPDEEHGQCSQDGHSDQPRRRRSPGPRRELRRSGGGRLLHRRVDVPRPAAGRADVRVVGALRSTGRGNSRNTVLVLDTNAPGPL